MKEIKSLTASDKNLGAPFEDQKTLSIGLISERAVYSHGAIEHRLQTDFLMTVESSVQRETSVVP